MKRKKRKDYKFTEKKHSGAAVAALILAFVPLALFFYAVALSYLKDGNADQRIGCIGIAAVLAALFTLWLSIREVRRENVIKKVPVAGVVLSVFMLAGWAAVYVLGWIGA